MYVSDVVTYDEDIINGNGIREYVFEDIVSDIFGSEKIYYIDDDAIENYNNNRQNIEYQRYFRSNAIAYPKMILVDGSRISMLHSLK